MPRCDYDVVFYRVFCVTLLGIAFTFTVILTNVYIDIDGLIAHKEDKHKASATHEIAELMPESITPSAYGDDINYEDNDDNYRSKRSIETQNFLFHIKNPKIKNILTNRLETLLEALDAEESSQSTNTDKDTLKNEIKNVPREEIVIVDDNKLQETKLKRHKDEEMVHLTMHNILLQGIIGHMDISEVYKRVQTMMNTLNKVRRDEQANEKTEDKSNNIQSNEAKSVPKNSLADKFVAELINCNHLQHQTLNGAIKTVAKKTNLDMDPARLLDDGIIPRKKEIQEKNTPPNMLQEKSLHTGPNVFIKTIVDIDTFAHDRNDTFSKENLHGIFEVIYNGKSIKFTRADEKQATTPKNIADNIVQPKHINTLIKKHSETKSQAIPIDLQTVKGIPKSYINRFVTEYFNHFPTENKDEIKENSETKRLKRHVKIKFNQEKKRAHFFEQIKPDIKKASDDDELFVEIETHFDSKGLKGEKKKKLIRSLIDKIQKAIHSEEIKKTDHDSKKSKNKPLHVRKRIQNPLEHKFQEHKSLELDSKYMVPVSNIIHRQLNPIVVPRTTSDDANMPKVKDRSGEAWKKDFVGPTFLTATKSINSAEMSEVEVDYNRVLDVNGIPQRLQKPLNTDLIDQNKKPNSYFDLGNMKFLLKDVDGSGFSIGFNQYVDEPPDPETMKLFTGLENVIKTYHQNVDQIQEEPQPIELNLRNGADDSMKDDHIIVRRSVNHKHDYHTNEYKIIYDGNFLPYNDYKDIYGQDNSKTNIEYRTNRYTEPLIVDEHIFDKNLKPSEIFGLANLFRRKKRSIKVKKISNLKTKIKLNRYLNTKAMATKRIFLNKKRQKRQISKIRIIASDVPYKRSSDEKLYLVSSENIFADRPFVKDVEGMEGEGEKMDETDYTPYQSEESISSARVFESKSRKNNLMSKYPHIFMEEIARSKEDFSSGPTLLVGKIPLYKNGGETENVEYDFLSETTTETANKESPDKIFGVEEIVNALQAPKTNYKVTLKVSPKNKTSDMSPGFKEIHTSINKRYNKNGLIYTSLVNVSEISKITNLNKTKVPEYNKADTDLVRKVKEEHDKVQMLLKQHQNYINEQLAKLNTEKSNIEAILIEENNTVAPHFDYLNVMMPSKPNKVLHMSRDEVNKMAHAIFDRKYVSNATTNEVSSGTAELPSKPTTSSSVTSTSIVTTLRNNNLTNKTLTNIQNSSNTTLPPSPFNDNIKNNLLITMERNEKLTDQILKKIDKNTEMLQVFLKKITNSMETHKIERRIPTKIIKDEKTENPIQKLDHPQPFSVDWRQQGTLPLHPNNDLSKNNSQIAIPFFYAYQHPIMPLKMNSPVASVVYHGTIHTNAIHLKDVSAERDKEMPRHKKSNSNNQTRFFIDEVGNDYKVIPVNSILDKHPLYKNGTAA